MSQTIKYGEDKPVEPKPVKESIETPKPIEEELTAVHEAIEDLMAVHETVETTDIAGEQFDPNEHNADVVNDYLHATKDLVERARVLQAERAGKNRKTVGL